MWRSGSIAFVICAMLQSVVWGDCPVKQDHRSEKNSGVLVTNFTITGTQTLGSAELGQIQSTLIGYCFDDNSQQLQERIRASFQDHGYFAAEVSNVRMTSSDPLARPKPVSVEVEVREGLQYRVAEVQIVGNHAFGQSRLRRRFPVRKGDLFARDKIARPLESLRSLYVSDGFIDVAFVPDTDNFSNGTIRLTVTIAEGRQYRMGRLEVVGREDLAETLRAQWQLQGGAAFDFEYISRYIDVNRGTLPKGFNQDDVRLERDCTKSTIDVKLLLDPSTSQSQEENTICDTID